MANFKFQYPGAYHHARFMSQAIYMLKMQLLSKQITWLSPEEKEEITMMSEFLSVFYVVWWLQGYLSASAPMNDLRAMFQMRGYKRYNQLVSDTCLASMRLHTWYLTEELVVFCLADEECPFRNDVAAALVKTDFPPSYNPQKPELPKLLEETWPQDGNLPNLASFIGQRSNLLFSLLGFTEAEMDWLKFDSVDWNKFSGYKKFENYVNNLLVVNDAGERGVKAAQEVVHKTTNEPLRQDMIITTAEQRKHHPHRGKGMGTKAKLAKYS